MQDINKLLGQAPTQGAPTQPPSPVPQAPEGEGEKSANPLEAMAEISKTKDKKKSPSVSDEMDEETIKQILMSGENSDGLFTPDKPIENPEELHEEVDEEAKLKPGDVKEQSKKYSKKFREDITKNPDKYKIMTPKGEMTVREAMSKGYNPLTRRFEKDKTAKEIVGKHKKNLNEADQEVLDKILDPKSANIAKADAEQMGLSADSPMVRQDEAIQGAAPALPGQAPTPEIPAAPQQPAAPQGGPDIAALLGGAS